MPSLNLALDYFEHPKTRRLVVMLGPGAEILPIRLWTYCAKYHRDDGVLSAYSDTVLEDVLGWKGTPGAAVKALLECGQYVGKDGFIETVENGYRVHGWDEHEGHFAKYHEAAKIGAQARWGKRLKKVEKDSPCDPHSDPQCLSQCGSDAVRNAPAGQYSSSTPVEEVKRRASFRRAFVIPSQEEVTAEVRRLGYHFDPEAFYAFYESKGWKVGESAMKSWKACLVTWEKRWQEKHATKSLQIDPAENERRRQLALAAGGPR